MPLATAGALVLLLSSLSIHGAALQQATRLGVEWRTRQRSDLLDGAAQRLAATLAGHLRAGGGLGEVEAPLGQSVQPLQLQRWSAASDPTSGATTASFTLIDGTTAAPRHYKVKLDGPTGRVVAFAGLEP